MDSGYDVRYDEVAADGSTDALDWIGACTASTGPWGPWCTSTGGLPFPGGRLKAGPAGPAGSVLGSAIGRRSDTASGYLTDHHGVGAVASAAVHGYTMAFSISAALLGAAGAVSLLVLRAQRRDLPAPLEPVLA